MRPPTRRTVAIPGVVGLLLLLALACPTLGSAQSRTFNDHSSSEAKKEYHGHAGDLLGGPRKHHGGDEEPVAPVPEPGTMALVGMGVVALGAAVRKRIRR